MKSFLLRPALMLALLAGLSACGGKASFEVGGTITGLKYSGLELNDGKSSVFPTADGHFGFPAHISYGDSYQMTIKTQPAHQKCVFLNNTDSTQLLSHDTAGRLAVINDNINCTVNSHSVGGAVIGLSAGSVVVINGSLYAPVTVNATDASQTYTIPGVPYDQVYGLTVLTQPDGLTCRFASNSTGKMGDNDITDLNLVCAPSTP